MDAIAVPRQTSGDVPHALTVTELTRLLRDTLRANPLLTRVLVRGEASNVQSTPAGHRFFTLKDSNAQVACVLFRDEAEALEFDLEDGMEVVASGDVELYARRGEVQLVVRALTPAGVGAFWATFQRTRRRLQAEGLFDAARKRSLPRFPRRIGVVTSEAGAVVHDIVTILCRRFPLCDVVVVPALVQGPEAPQSLRSALSAVASRVDLVILARGGGSLEDLWCFNDESLARAIATYPVPIVSAVGHETDVTIADFVADVRAPTPSGAAELVSPDASELIARIRMLSEGLVDAIGTVLRERGTGLASAGHRISPRTLLRDMDSVQARLRRDGSDLLDTMVRVTKEGRDALAVLAGRLDAVSPFATLRRGYAIAEREDGRPVTRLADVAVGDALRLRLQDGLLHTRIDAKEDTT